MLNSSKRKQIVNIFLAAGALSGMLAVIIGAFGAHGLENLLSEHAMQRFHTGVEYQFYHVAALLSVGILANNHKNMPRILKLSGIFFIMGILLFSGSLYLYALTGKTFFGIITPFGGLGFIGGWLLLILYIIKHTKSTQLIHKQ